MPDDFAPANSLTLTRDDAIAAGFLRIELDWDAYWADFKALHGDPVQVGGRLVFADGWAYSSTDPAGPEWPPPSDPVELWRLQRAYWNERLRYVKLEREHLRGVVEAIKEQQSGRSCPLVQRSMTRDEHGKVVMERRAVNAREIEQGRLLWLEQDAEECARKLAELMQRRPAILPAETRQVQDG